MVNEGVDLILKGGYALDDTEAVEEHYDEDGSHQNGGQLPVFPWWNLVIKYFGNSMAEKIKKILSKRIGIPNIDWYRETNILLCGLSLWPTLFLIG